MTLMHMHGRGINSINGSDEKVGLYIRKKRKEKNTHFSGMELQRNHTINRMYFFNTRFWEQIMEKETIKLQKKNTKQMAPKKKRKIMNIRVPCLSPYQ